MPELDNLILAYIRRPGYKPQKPDSLAKKLQLGKRELPALHEAIDRLSHQGHLSLGVRNLIRPQASPGSVIGILKRTTTGAGYVIPHERAGQEASPTRDIYIDAREIRDAHTGDEVLVRLLSRKRPGGQQCGRIEEVILRATTTFVGTYFETDGRSFVRVDGRTFQEPVLVDDPGAKRPKRDEKVVIEMLRFPTANLMGEAVLVKVLGPREATGVDTLSIIHEFRLPDEFPDEALDESRLVVQQFDADDLSDRLDLTGETIVTIDPVDARDFDDAISLERHANGHWKLGVHIADVAAFVPADGPLDVEARLRGNSVYLPDRVIPMLPEVISNGLASLQEGKIRFTKSVFMEFTATGTPVHSEFANSAIRVTKRFAYEQVMPIVEQPDAARDELPKKILDLLLRMHEFAMILRRKRLKEGALELTLAEVRLQLDEENRVVGAKETPHDASHQIIEEFMLAANIAVARKMTDLGLPFLRRVHADPSELRLRTLSQFVTALGYPMKRYQSRFDLQELLKRVEGKPEQAAVNFALLRSLKQAEYSEATLGHYALAVDHYCHFTSPIRRYPDLVVHRLLDSLIQNPKKPRAMNPLELAKFGRHCSMTERRAADAERELTKVKLLNHLKGHVGEEMDAVITGVEAFGIFCTGVQWPVDGMIHVSALDPDEFFDHDAEAFQFVGRRRGKRYRLGDRIRVAIAQVDVDRRQLNFRLVYGASTTVQPDGSLAPVPKKSEAGKSSRRSASRPGKRERAEAKETGLRKPRRKKTGPPKKKGKKKRK